MELLRPFVVFMLLLVRFQCLKIVGVFPHPGRSHFRVFEPLLKALAHKGHEVTVLGYFPLQNEIPRYKDVVLKFPNGEMKNIIPIKNEKLSRLQTFYKAPLLSYEYGQVCCEAVLSSKEYKDFLKSNEDFDLIIAEYFITNCLLPPIIDKYRSPLIGVKSHAMMPWANRWVGNPDNPAYIPSFFMDYSYHMSFFERLEGTLMLLFTNIYYQHVIENGEHRVLKKHIGQDVSHPNELMYNTSLILTNSHYSIHGSRPFVPNVIEIGGIHLEDRHGLPKNIEKWINESTHGVIYFSLGSMIKGHTFPEERRQMFLKAFARLPQRVLWKWETETMPNKPDNVMLQKWMPQFDILCHPNVKAFIAHGGLLGATEAVHCGVPMIVMPQFGDQFTNAKAIEASGGGVILDFRSADEESIYNALKTVLDPSFNKKAKELSARFRDRPLPPLETAIYWVEYVARHGGAPHLRTAAVGMPLYQYLLLDVVAFLAVILFIVSYVFYRVTRAVFRKIFKSKPKDKVKRN